MGFYGASMRQLASRTGLSLSNIYNYYPSKSAVLLEILREASSAQLAQVQGAIERAGPGVVERFSAAVEAFLGYYIDNPEIGTVATSEFRYLEGEFRSEVVAARDETQSVLTRLIAEGVESGHFGTPYPHEAALAILTMCSAVTVWYRKDGGLGKEEICQRYSRFALSLLEVRPTTTRRRSQ